MGWQPTELFKWQKNGKEGRHFCCDLMDKNGDCIRAVAYNAVADDIFPRLKENQVFLQLSDQRQYGRRCYATNEIGVKQIYRISGGHFKVANKKYSKLSHDYDLTFATTTQITPITDPTRIAAFPTQQPDFLPLSQLASREHDDVVGTVTTAHAHDAPPQQHSRNGPLQR